MHIRLFQERRRIRSILSPSLPLPAPFGPLPLRPPTFPLAMSARQRQKLNLPQCWGREKCWGELQLEHEIWVWCGNDSLCTATVQWNLFQKKGHPLRPRKVSLLERCPLFRGKNVWSWLSWDCWRCPHLRGVLYEGFHCTFWLEVNIIHEPNSRYNSIVSCEVWMEVSNCSLKHTITSSYWNRLKFTSLSKATCGVDPHKEPVNDRLLCIVYSWSQVR